MMQQARSNNKVLEHLMRKKIKGELPGVLGRLVSCFCLLWLSEDFECKSVYVSIGRFRWYR